MQEDGHPDTSASLPHDDDPWLAALRQAGANDNDIVQGLPARETKQTQYDLRRESHGLNPTQRRTLFVSFDQEQTRIFWVSMAGARMLESGQHYPGFELGYVQGIYTDPIKLAWYATLETLAHWGAVQIRPEWRDPMPFRFSIENSSVCMKAFNIFFVLRASSHEYNAISASLIHRWIHELQWGLVDGDNTLLIPLPDCFETGTVFSRLGRQEFDFCRKEARSLYYLEGDPTDIIRARATYNFYSTEVRGKSRFMVLPWYAGRHVDSGFEELRDILDELD